MNNCKGDGKLSMVDLATVGLNSSISLSIEKAKESLTELKYSINALEENSRTTEQEKKSRKRKRNHNINKYFFDK